jgi:hypothetical protein
MKLSIGIVGLPNVGKSTLFKLLTHNEVHIANYPFVTIDPNVGIVPVTDPRLDAVVRVTKTPNKIPAVVEFYDIAGLVKNAHKGEGLGNQFLSHIRDVSVIVHVVRCFAKPDIVHIEQSVDPIRDIDIVNAELIFKDLETVKKTTDKLEEEARGGNKEKTKELELMRKLEAALDAQTPVYFLEKEIFRAPTTAHLNLLTAKPTLYLLNGSEQDVGRKVKDKITSLQSRWIIADLDGTPDLTTLIASAYQLLGLISFFTFNENEARAWTVQRGTKAQQAAGEIHSDFETKFIRAEVIFWKDLVDTGGWNEARQKGKIRTEGKEYVVQDGDVMLIRHGA